MKKTKPLTGAQKRKQKRELQEREEREQRELLADIERLKLGPTDLWKLITDWPDIFETHVLLSGKLNGSDIKMFYECCRASRRAVIRAKIELRKSFWFQSFLRYLLWSWHGKDIHLVRGYVYQTGRYLRRTRNGSALKSPKRTISNYSDGCEKRKNVLGII